MKFKLFFIFLFVFFFISVPANAFYAQKGDNLNFPKSKKFNESVALVGNNLTIDSDINGDLYCAGQRITINGSVKGDILCAGQNITISGPVDGSIRVAGQSLRLTSSISRNANIFGQSITLDPSSAVKGDLLSAGQDIQINAQVGRDLILAGQSLNLSSQSKVGGNFDYYIGDKSTINFDKKSITGQVNPYVSQFKSPRLNSTSVPWKQITILGLIFSFITSLIVGFVLLFFTASRLPYWETKVVDNPLMVFLTGLGTLFGVPVLFVALLLTILGIPLAFVLLLFYILGIILGSIISEALLGRWLIIRADFSPKPNPFLSFLLGLIVVEVFGLIPVLGGLFKGVLLCLGLGALFLSLLPQRK